ncbi:VCBS repeat-containing protein [Stackebrandtia endophytica]|uniref:VCBS repeat-containing protein n=1 Tax=Stackebrandtia endophytica TaxID=1496996 RepID=UPI001154BA15|nr:VCBS repeat-containing protein [Stackebrandtia endophytica]
MAVAVVTLTGEPAAANTCGSNIDSDFNGDGIADVAIGDPEATVGGHVGAGRVHVALTGIGTQTVTQSQIPDMGAEAGDGFGYALDSVDWNGDGCSDLVIGAPFEASGDKAESGMVILIPGSPGGLDPAARLIWRQGAAGIPGESETGDRFGYSVAAGVAAGKPFVVVGAPGETTGSMEQAGSVSYIRSDVKVTFDQDSSGVFGVVEAGDQYGYAVAASSRHFAVGGPGENVAGMDYSGTVGVFSHTITNGVPVQTGGVDQEQPGQGGIAEAGDWFGRSLSMVDYIHAGDTASDAGSLLAVGSPGEALGEVKAAGRIVTIRADGSLDEISSIHQGNTGVEGDVEPDDYFGWSVALANRAPGQAATWQNLLMAVGVPGEDSATHIDAGGVQVFSMVGAPGDHDVWAHGELQSVDRPEISDTRLGQYIHATAQHLFIGDPWGPSPAVYGIPWNNIVGSGTDPVLVYRPGEGGFPADGVGSFGVAIA